VEELTTSHLLDKTGVFPQIFGFTHNGLSEYYNSHFNTLKYTEDADFDSRLEVFGGHAPENSQLHWELEYQAIHLKYATEFLDVFYKTDRDVQEDNSLQTFRDELNEWLPNKLPERHNFQTKKSVARFIADTMHVFTVRHEIFGTNTAKYALDTTLMTGQVPIDHGPPSVESYYSLMCAFYATSRVSFGKMMTDNLLKLLPLFGDNQDRVSPVFQNLQNDYHALQAKWTSNDQEKSVNRDFMRNPPADLETGAGY